MTGEASSAADLLILTRHYGPEPTGSAPPMQELAEWFAGQGERVRVVTVRPNYPGTRIFDGYELGQHDNALEAGVRVRRLPTAPVRGTGLMSRMGPELMFLGRLLGARLTGAERPCPALISLCPSIFTVLGALPFRTAGGRHVAVVHDIQSGLGSALGGGLTRALMPILQGLERWTLNQVDTVVVLSEEMRRHLQTMGVRTPVEIQPPTVSAKFIRPRPEPQGPLTLMYSGNLGRKQGLGQVLDLAQELRRRDSNVRIIVRGGGAMRDTLVAEAAELGLTNLSIEDLVPRDQIPVSLAQAHLHLVPQIASGGDFAVPSKIFSIMAAGRTFIATAEAGSSLAKLAADTDAFVYAPPDDASAFADAVETLLAAPQRRAAMAAA
ncbi:MAG: glycosyltransferase family 4 protein, partial [Ramlibacter sp.]|nr:glycosyltransferase family 4 protein [Ramlibacter sp.]